MYQILHSYNYTTSICPEVFEAGFQDEQSAINRLKEIVNDLHDRGYRLEVSRGYVRAFLGLSRLTYEVLPVKDWVYMD